MSLSGQITCFADHLGHPVPSVIRGIVSLVGAERVRRLMWQSKQSMPWAETRNDFTEDAAAFGEMEPPQQILPDMESSWIRRELGRDLMIDDACRMISMNGVYELYFASGTCLAGQARHALSQIPASVRDTFVPNSPSVMLGQHDIYESTPEQDTYYGSAVVSLSLFGYGTPHDWVKYRELALALPEIRRLREDLERVVGAPVQQCVYWDV